MHNLYEQRFGRLFGLADGGGGGDGGNGGQDGGQGGGDGGQGGGDGGQGGGQGGGEWKPPEGLAPDFAGKTADETLAKLMGGYTDLNKRFEGLRTQVAQRPAAPKSPDEYTFAPADDVKQYFGDVTNDPMLKSARAAAHKAGMSQEQFASFISDTYAPLIAEGLLPKPYEPLKEVQTFKDTMGLDKKSTQEALVAAETFSKGLAAQLQVPEAMKPQISAVLAGLTDTAAGNVLLSALSSRFNDLGIKIDGGQQTNNQLTAEDLKKLDQDPRIDPRNRNHTDAARRFDPDLRKRYDEAYQRNEQKR
jgi:hypothetical protein